MKKIFFILIVILIFISPSFTQETRIALVIGNSEYLYQSKLKNPVRDAILMAQTLESLDFDVILDTNITTEDKFIDAISEFGTKRESYDVGFIFYAGHGMQVDGKNYLLPTEEDFKDDEKRVKQNAIGVEMVMEYLTKQTDQVNVLILDACRNNPIQNTRSVGVGGLAEMQSKGSLIAFSTTAGNVAKDGDGEHSIYCMSLVKNMLIEGIDLGQVFRNVRKEVNELTGQSTVNYDQLTGNAFYLKRASYTDDIILIDSLIEVENYTMALEEAIKILAKDPNNIPALKRKGIIKYRKYKAEYDGSDLKKAIQLDPMDPDLHVNMGRYYGVIKEYESAYAEFDKAIQLDSTYAEAYYWKARVFDEDDLVDSAIYYYSIAINLKPKEMLYYTTRAYFYQKQKLFDKALADYTKAIEIEPKKPFRYCNKGDLYRNHLNQPYNALNQYTTAINMDSSYYFAWSCRARTYGDKLHNYEMAIHDSKYITTHLDTNDVIILNWIGIYYHRLGKEKKAKAYYNKVIQKYNSGLKISEWDITNGVAWAFNNLGVYYQRDNDYLKAAKKYNKAVQIDTEEPARYYWRSWFYFNCSNQLDSALNDAQKAIDLDPENSKWLLSKAKMLELSNRMEEATEIYKKAKKLFPNNKDVQLENARFLGIIGKLKLSQKEFEKIKHLKTIDSRYLNYQTEIQFKNKGFNSVEKLANECIKIFPQDTLSRSYLADLLFQKGNYAASCSHYTYLISMMENNNKYLDYEPNLNQINLSELYIKLGNTFEKMKAPESQCMALKKALSNLDEMYGIYDKKRMEKELEEKIKTLCN